MATAAKKLNGNSNGIAPEELSKQVEILREDLSTLTQTIADLGKAKGEEAVASAKAKADEVREKAADTAETARLQAMEIQGQANDFIKNQPATALGIVAGVGFLVGYMTARK